METFRLKKKLWWYLWSIGIVLWIVVYIQHANGNNETVVLPNKNNQKTDTLFSQTGYDDGTKDSTDLKQSNVSAESSDKNIPSSFQDTLQKAQNEETEKECINVNSATVEEIITLKGIGPVLAERIVSFRQNNGNFKEASDLIKVKGIGEGKLSKIKDFICF